MAGASSAGRADALAASSSARCLAAATVARAVPAAGTSPASRDMARSSSLLARRMSLMTGRRVPGATRAAGTPASPLRSWSKKSSVSRSSALRPGRSRLMTAILSSTAPSPSPETLPDCSSLRVSAAFLPSPVLVLLGDPSLPVRGLPSASAAVADSRLRSPSVVLTAGVSAEGVPSVFSTSPTPCVSVRASPRF